VRMFDRRSRLERLLDEPPLDLPSSKVTKAGLIAVGGVAALTAASARISSLRRRSET
jgi:hypothetical protein